MESFSNSGRSSLHLNIFTTHRAWIVVASVIDIKSIYCLASTPQSSPQSLAFSSSYLLSVLPEAELCQIWSVHNLEVEVHCRKFNGDFRSPLCLASNYHAVNSDPTIRCVRHFVSVKFDTLQELTIYMCLGNSLRDQFYLQY